MVNRKHPNVSANHICMIISFLSTFACGPRDCLSDRTTQSNLESPFRDSYFVFDANTTCLYIIAQVHGIAYRIEVPNKICNLLFDTNGICLHSPSLRDCISDWTTQQPNTSCKSHLHGSYVALDANSICLHSPSPRDCLSVCAYVLFLEAGFSVSYWARHVWNLTKLRTLQEED